MKSVMRTINSMSVKENHPFFCARKRVRKSAWATPEYLSGADWELASAAARCASEEDFRRVVFATEDTECAFFWRVIGWPEGRGYMRFATPATHYWQGLVKRELSLVRAACDGILLPRDGATWLDLVTSDGGAHLRFQAPVTHDSFDACCQVAIDLASRIMPAGLASYVVFLAGGDHVRTVGSDRVGDVRALWLQRLDAIAAPFLKREPDDIDVLSEPDGGHHPWMLV